VFIAIFIVFRVFHITLLFSSDFVLSKDSGKDEKVSSTSHMHKEASQKNRIRSILTDEMTRVVDE